MIFDNLTLPEIICNIFVGIGIWLFIAAYKTKDPNKKQTRKNLIIAGCVFVIPFLIFFIYYELKIKD
jgi:hypothetical protein